VEPLDYESKPSDADESSPGGCLLSIILVFSVIVLGFWLVIFGVYATVNSR
jgi:hypothetical protein